MESLLTYVNIFKKFNKFTNLRRIQDLGFEIKMVSTNPRRNLNFGGAKEKEKKKEEKVDMALLALVPSYTLRLSARG
jgi:hypothetical protein